LQKLHGTDPTAVPSVQNKPLLTPSKQVCPTVPRSWRRISKAPRDCLALNMLTIENRSSGFGSNESYPVLYLAFLVRPGETSECVCAKAIRVGFPPVQCTNGFSGFAGARTRRPPAHTHRRYRQHTIRRGPRVPPQLPHAPRCQHIHRTTAIQSADAHETILDAASARMLRVSYGVE